MSKTQHFVWDPGSKSCSAPCGLCGKGWRWPTRKRHRRLPGPADCKASGVFLKTVSKRASQEQCGSSPIISGLASCSSAQCSFLCVSFARVLPLVRAVSLAMPACSRVHELRARLQIKSDVCASVKNCERRGQEAKCLCGCCPCGC